MGNPDAVEETQQNTQKEKETERFITSTHSDFTRKAKSCLPVPVLFTVNVQDIPSKRNKCRSPGHLTVFK